MLPDRVSNPGPLTYESGALPIALRGPASSLLKYNIKLNTSIFFLLYCPLISTELTVLKEFFLL